MLLKDFVLLYIESHENPIRESTAVFLKSAVGTMRKWRDREVRVAELSDQFVNKFLDWLRKNRANDTFRTVRGAIKTLWLAAVKKGLNTSPPDELKKHKAQQRIVVAWTAAELRSLIETAGTYGNARFRNSNMRKREYFASITSAAYDCGLRLGDMLSVERRNIMRGKDGFGRFAFQTSKTNDVVIRELTPSTMDLIDEHLKVLGRSSAYVWPLWGCREAFYRQFKLLVEAAKIRPGTFKYVRRCAVTQGEIDEVGRGTLIAGHKNRRVTLESYIDQSQLPRSYYRPTDLSSAVRREMATGYHVSGI